MNEILGAAARYQQLLTRKFGVLGGAPSPQLTPEVTPEFDISSGPENRILAAEVLCTGNLSVAAVAAKSSIAQLQNPTGSNVIVVVEAIRASSFATASYLQGGVIKTGALSILPSAGRQTRRDTRSALSGNYPVIGTAVMRGDNDPPTVAAANLFYEYCAADALLTYDIPIVLSPGYCVMVKQATVNLVLSCSFAWREVPMAQGEAGPF